jgi:hypothetical protein
MAHQYLKRWRRTEATTLALALQSSSSSDEQNDVGCVSSYQPTSQLDLSDPFPEVSEYVESSDECEYLDSADEEELPKIADELVNWGRINNVTRTGMNELLDILRRNGHHLPKDIRT